MNPEQPLVSIIIPTYNRAHLIGETLDSVLAQTYTNWECIVVDDGSTDNTAEVVQGYLDKDPRFQYHHRPTDRPKGANACRNYGFELSKGEYIQWLDSDDLISENKIESQLVLLTDKKGDSLMLCNWSYFKETILEKEGMANPFSTFEDAKEFIKYLYSRIGYFPIHAYLIPRALQVKAGLWNEYLKINQDAELMTRVICNANLFMFCDDSKVYYRVSEKERVSSLNKENIYDFYYSWKFIDTYLKVRFKKEDLKEFKVHKIKIYNRNPKDLKSVEDNDMKFFSEVNTNKKTQKFKNYLKKRFNKIFSFFVN